MRESVDSVIGTGVEVMMGTVGVHAEVSGSRPSTQWEALVCVRMWPPGRVGEQQTLCSLRVRTKQHFVPQKHDSTFLLTFPQEHSLRTRENIKENLRTSSLLARGWN